jgi:hypothetical protein
MRSEIFGVTISAINETLPFNVFTAACLVALSAC